MAKRKENKERIGVLPVLIVVVAFAICYLVAFSVLTPKRYNVAVGGMASQTITSPRTIENTTATEALRNAARKETPPIYKLDDALIEKHITDATNFFKNITEYRSDAEGLRQVRAAGLGLPLQGELRLDEWKLLISGTEQRELLKRFAIELTPEEGWALMQAEDGAVLRLQDAILPKLTTSLQAGLEETARPARLAAYVQELNATSLPNPLKTIGEKALSAFLLPTFVLDERATSEARDVAAAQVEAVEIKRGDVIIKEGAVVTEEEYDILRMLELVRSERADTQAGIGIALYLLCVFGVFTAYMIIYERSVFVNTKTMLIITVTIALTMATTLAFSAINGRVAPCLIGVMLVTLLVGARAAIAVNALLALCVAVLAGGRGAGMMGYESTVMVAAMLVGGQVAVFLLRDNQKRGTIIAAGLVAGLASTLVIVAAQVMTARTLLPTLVTAAWAVGCNAVCAVLVVGTMSLWENIFDIATSARLNELSNTNNALLRQLMTEAPGTYHHSMMTAVLAENAAEEVGADPLLCRVGAYYHDVGKLRRPIYFKENQKASENIHDTLPAAESANIIIAHLKDGVVLLNKHKLPSAVVQIAYEHHGTTLVAYFYHKATQEGGGKALQQKNYRYPGARPSTKESAIVHLADSCEAAVRSIENPTREDVEMIVDKIIKGKLEDGQLAIAPLDLRDLTLIQQSFLRSFAAIMHERIAYPDQKKMPEGRA